MREVLVLKEYTDFSYAEIGKMLLITEGNVKVRVFRARAQLAKLLKEVL
jgi:RNA polymerase sigma-70 factor (ECF subfamily)